MLLIIFGRAAQFILLLAMMRVATNFLSPAEMGRMSLIVTATSFFALFLVNPVGMFINRRIHAWDSKGLVQYYLNYYWFYLLLVCLTAAICMVVVNRMGIYDFHTSTQLLLFLVCGSLLFNTVNQTVIPSLNLIGFRGWFVFLTLATIVISFISSVILILYFTPKAEFWLFGLLVGQALFAIIGRKILLGKLNQDTRSAKVLFVQYKFLFKFAWPIAVSIGLTWIQTQGYRFFLKDTLGLASLGLFVVGYGLSAGIIAGFESVFTTYFQPTFYKQVSSGDKNEQANAWNNYAAAILPSLILLVCFVVVIAPELTRLLVGPAFHSAYHFVVWGALAEATRVTTGIYGMVAHAKMKTKLLLIPNILGASTAILLIWWLVPQQGVVGAGIALVLAGVSVVVAMHKLMHSELDIKIPYRDMLKSIAVGGGFWGVAIFMRTILIGKSDSIMAAVLLLSVLSVCFLSMLYLMLKPMFNRKAEST